LRKLKTSAIFGRNLRQARVQANLTQGELARRTGLKQQYISLIEGGSQDVELMTAVALASALGRELWTMLGTDNNLPRSRA
jgi:transcriptional regulator with XRE-family HTH domain